MMAPILFMGGSTSKMTHTILERFVDRANYVLNKGT